MSQPAIPGTWSVPSGGGSTNGLAASDGFQRRRDISQRPLRVTMKPLNEEEGDGREPVRVPAKARLVARVTGLCGRGNARLALCTDAG